MTGLRFSWLFAAVLVGVVSFASPAAAATDLEDDTPVQGRYTAGVTPFLVRISTDEAVRGTLEVRVDSILVAEVPVEATGGTERTVIVPVRLEFYGL